MEGREGRWERMQQEVGVAFQELAKHLRDPCDVRTVLGAPSWLWLRLHEY